MKPTLSHTDSSGKARMVDVSNKSTQLRSATATGHIRMAGETVRLIRENRVKKGDVISVAETAGIQGGKRTSDLIPLCHPLQITWLDVQAKPDDTGVLVTATACCTGPTGIEMEALTAVSVALLTIYDMCKAADRSMEIGEIRLTGKTKHEIS